MSTRHWWTALRAGIGLFAVVFLAGMTSLHAGPPAKEEADREVRVIVVEGDEPDGGRVEIICKDGDCESDHEGRAFLGVHIEDSPEGTRIVGLVEDSPAEKAGLREGDIIVALDGKPIRGPASLTARLREYDPGTAVTVEVLRDGKREQVRVTLGERPKRWRGRPFVFRWDPEELEEHLRELRENLGGIEIPRLRGWWWRKPRLGVQLVEPTPELREYFGGQREAGVIVSKVLPDSPAERAGIRVGDLIVRADGESVRDAEDLIEAVEDAVGGTLELELIRNKKRMTLEIQIPEAEEEEDIPRGPRA